MCDHLQQKRIESISLSKFFDLFPIVRVFCVFNLLANRLSIQFEPDLVRLLTESFRTESLTAYTLSSRPDHLVTAKPIP